MWNKLLKSKHAQEAADTGALAGPSLSPSKRKSVLKLHRDDGSLRLNSSLKLPSIPQKVRSTLNIHGNASQLTLTSQSPHKSETSRDLSRRASQEVVSTATRPKAARRSSFNLLSRRPSIDALRSSPPPPSASRQKESTSSNYTRERAVTVSGSVRSILREPNTPGTGKNVRFFSSEEYDIVAAENLEHQSAISRSTPPEDLFFEPLQQSSPAKSFSGMARPTSRPSRPSVTQIFAPSALTARDQASPLFEELDAPPIQLSTSLHVPNDGLPVKDGSRRQTADLEIIRFKDNSMADTTSVPSHHEVPIPHDRITPSSFRQTVFYSADSKRSSSSTSSMTDLDSSITSTSSSPSIGRSRSFSDTLFLSGTRASSSDGAFGSAISGCREGKDSAASEPDPFSVNAKTYYTPQTMIPSTPPNGASHHVRRASKEESIIFALQTQLDMQNELCGQFEADLRARDELVGVLRKKLAEVEEEETKKRKLLKAWKKKVLELEKTCRLLEEEVEGSRQESMDRSIMDEASSEALQILHRQISELEREKDAWKKTEVVLREELRRLEKLAGERRNESAMLRASLGSLSELEGKHKEEQMAMETLKSTVVALEQQRDEEKERHEAAERAWQTEKADLHNANIELTSEVNKVKQQFTCQNDELAVCKTRVSVAFNRAEEMAKSLEAAEAGTCALAMERDSMKLQFKKLLREEQGRIEAICQKLRASESHVVELEQDAQRNLQRVTDNEELMSKMKQEHSAALEAALQDATSKQLQIDAQTAVLFDSEQLKAQVCELQQESADKEVRMLQIMKQRAQDKQDLESLNIALDAKQQELELLKRRFGVRGTAGNTAAQTNKSTHQRRDSLVQATPRMARPSSIASESGVEADRERKASADGGSKIPALGRSTRLNTSANTAPTLSKVTFGSMGPPPLRPRSSVVGAPTVGLRTLARSSSATYSSTKTKTAKPSTTTANPAVPAVEQGEKENADATASRRLSRIPTLAM
ncbi:hypothetical protein GGX14DRAFT_668782 [Mycena pura]|uniref:Uncharacterized protein n=1 Tax=Mycena pura TaxID=153505 RepID=A0AAD6UY69_9AGAR|nr:hypothetical protein GGX14DRAFT_668782 [Mycena pura]